MKNIREYIKEYIADGGHATLVTVGGQAGVIFEAQGNEFIPFHELGYNTQLDFYQIAKLPDVTNEAVSNIEWSVHPVMDGDTATGTFALQDGEGFTLLLGERWEVAEALQALLAFIAMGAKGEPIQVGDDLFGNVWLSINEACLEAHEVDPEKYPYYTDMEKQNLEARIRSAARRIPQRIGARQTASGRWKFNARLFSKWIGKTT